MRDEVALIARLYAKFNAREIENALAALHEEVVWANGMEGGYVHGRDGVREYWQRQWSMIDPSVEPEEFSRGATGEIVVKVHQRVCDLRGNRLFDGIVNHVFHIESGMIKRFDIR